AATWLQRGNELRVLGTSWPEISPAALFRCRLGFTIGFAAERDGELIDRLRDRGFRRLLDQRHTVVTHFDHYAVIIRHLPEDFAADRFLSLLEADLSGVVADPVH